MSFSLKVSNAAFSNFVDKAVPYLGSATGFWLFGGSAQESLANLAPNATVPAGTLVGAGVPLYGAGYIDFRLPASTVGSSMDSGITPTPSADYTYISVAAPTANDGLCGTAYDATAGHLIYVGTSKVGMVTANGGAVQITPTVTSGALQFFAHTRSAAGRAVYMHDGTAMQSATGAAVAGGASHSYRVGPLAATFVNQALTATTRHAANMLFPVALTAPQVLEIYGYLKFKLAKRGVTVL